MTTNDQTTGSVKTEYTIVDKRKGVDPRESLCVKDLIPSLLRLRVRWYQEALYKDGSQYTAKTLRLENLHLVVISDSSEMQWVFLYDEHVSLSKFLLTDNPYKATTAPTKAETLAKWNMPQEASKLLRPGTDFDKSFRIWKRHIWFDEATTHPRPDGFIWEACSPKNFTSLAEANAEVSRLRSAPYDLVKGESLRPTYTVVGGWE